MKIIKVPTFNFKELHGSILKIYVSETEDGTLVVGLEEDTDKIFVLHQEINEETPAIINVDVPKIDVPGLRAALSNMKLRNGH